MYLDGYKVNSKEGNLINPKLLLTKFMSTAIKLNLFSGILNFYLKIPNVNIPLFHEKHLAMF